MNANEAVVRVKLDTRSAKSDLDELTKKASGSAAGIGRGISSSLGAGVNALGLGAAFGIGANAILGPTQSGASSVIGEALGGIGAQLEHFFLGDLGPEAKAAARTREMTMNAYDTIAGIKGHIPSEARSFAKQAHGLILEQEKGRAMFEQDDQFRGPGLEKIASTVAERISKAISDGFDKWGAILNGLGAH